MKLKDATAQMIMNDMEIRLLLALELGFSDPWIKDLAEKNKSNGPLTTIAAVNLIKHHKGLTDEEIYYDEKRSAVST